MKSIVKNLLNKIGYDISRVSRFSGLSNPYCGINLESNKEIVDLEALAQISLSIPGMISAKSGQILYTLCYMQELRGDVVEVGSWQGRSTSFLARAVKNSRNGDFYAIDHFGGNVGKEKFYKVNKDDLSDLKTGFLLNMKNLGLADSVHLLDMPDDQAAKEIQHVKIRFLFIDGDHTRKGVETDIELFFPRLMSGSIVVFDDFSDDAPGLVEAVDSLLARKEFSRIMSYARTLVLII
jgi:predicted O-methyltransferase YrrM